jgi:hypothetical protein
MKEKEININEVLKGLKEIIGDQAQQIAILKAIIESNKSAEDKVE